MRSLVLCVAFIASAVSAQTEPPLVPIEEDAPTAPAESPSYADRCFAVPAMVWIPHTSGGFYAVNPRTTSAPLSSFHGAAPVTAPPSSTSSSSSSGGGGDIGKAVLVLAVVAVAVLPIIVYVADDDAPAVVEQRFRCPTFGLDLVGGADFGLNGAGGGGLGRMTFGFSYFGADFQYELSSLGTRALAGHLMLRFAPKKHIEPNLAFGYRNMVLGGRMRHGLEVGVPHRYVFWREGLKQFGLELRPTLMFGLGSLDAGLEAALIYSIAEPFQVRLGGKVQSFGDDILGGVNGGVSLVF